MLKQNLELGKVLDRENIGRIYSISFLFIEKIVIILMIIFRIKRKKSLS